MLSQFIRYPLALFTLLLLASLVNACKRSSQTSYPSPTPEPTPLVLPRKPYNLPKLWSGITLNAKLETEQTEQSATDERSEPNSYTIDLTLNIHLPKACTTVEQLAANDSKLPHLLSDLPQLLQSATVSPAYAQLYQNKIDWCYSRLLRLDELLSKHNFFDCQTILQLVHPVTGRHAILMQSDMDVNTDGSDGDRNVEIDASSPFFQPQTSYRWRKKTDRPNPYLAKTQARIDELKQSLSTNNLSLDRIRELNTAIEINQRRLIDLKKYSFLVGTTDPFIVLPGFMLRGSGPFTPKFGDYAIVIYNNELYPAIVGDAGPSFKAGEASMRLCKEIDSQSSGIRRAVTPLKVSYLIFPGSAEKSPAPPDLNKWREKCFLLLNEIGGSPKDLYAWKDIVKPWPTPTPTPTPTSAESPVELPSPTSSPSASKTETPLSNL